MINTACIDDKDAIKSAELIEAGLLVPPFTKLTLENHLPSASAEALAQFLKDYSNHGLTPVQVALVLRSYAAGRQASDLESASVEVVVSGPDVTATSRDTGVVLRQLFEKVRNKVLVVGFAVHQGKTIFHSLAKRMDECEDLKATLCINVKRERGSTSLDRMIVQRFADRFVEQEWPGSRLPNVFYDPRSLAASSKTVSSLHAKCVVIDGSVSFVTSANFTEAAQVRNMELGLLVETSTVADRIEQHFHTLIKEGYLLPLPLK